MHHLFKLQEIKVYNQGQAWQTLLRKKQWFVQSAEPDLWKADTSLKAAAKGERRLC